MKRIGVLFARHEFQAVVFCLSLVLFSWPLVSSSDFDRINSMFIYLFVGWTVIIFLQFLISKILTPSSSKQSDDDI
jgi:hypothetical protein